MPAAPAENAPSPGLHLAAVEVRYGRQVAVSGIDLDVAPAEIHVLLGASGSGKSTILQTIAGHQQAAEGSIRLTGVDLDVPTFRRGERHVLPADKRPLALVQQNQPLLDHLTAIGNIAQALPRTRRDEAAHWLRTVGLTHVADRFPAELSGGEQQRVALARALALKPALLLLDEPFSNIDPARRSLLRTAVFTALRESAVTTVLVTHSAQEALDVADRITVLHAGRRVQTGTPEQVYRRPLSEVAARSLGEVQFLNTTPLDDLTVLTCAGPVALHAPDTGEPVLVRPEQVQVHDDATRGVAAQVERASFRGPDWRVLLRLENGVRLMAQLRATTAPEGAVRISIDSACAQLAPDPDFRQDDAPAVGE